MTILNVVWSSSRVVVAVDTNVAQAAGLPNLLDGAPKGPLCKLVPLPGLGVVLAARGSAAFLPMVVHGAMLASAGRGIDFDKLLDLMPGIVQASHQHCVETVLQSGVRLSEFMRYELAVVGWSASRGRMAALNFWQYSEEEGPQVFELDQDWPAVLAPRFDFEWEHDPPRNSAAMFALAKLQVEEARTKGPAGTGGNLIVATVTRESVTIVDHGDLSAARSLIV